MMDRAVQNDRKYRVDAATRTLTYWLVGKDGHADGLTLAAGGNFWWADAAVRGLARLDPDAVR